MLTSIFTILYRRLSKLATMIVIRGNQIVVDCQYNCLTLL